MLPSGPAKRLIITINEAQQWHGRRLYNALLELLRHKGLAGATVSRAVAGFTGRDAIKAIDIVDISGPLPVRIEVVDTSDAINAVLPDVYDMVERGLVEVQDTQVVKWWPDAPRSSAPPQKEALMRLVGKAKALTIFVGQKDAWENEPLYEAIVKRARQLGIAGATVFRGMLSYGAHGHVHRHKTLTLSSEDPIMISIIDSKEHIDKLLSALDGMLSGGCLITISDVTVVKYAPHGEEAVGVPLEPEGAP